MDLLQTHLWMADLIYRAGEQIRKRRGQDLTVEEKSSFRDLVTNVDKETEAFFVENIRAKYPTHKIMGEESKNNRFTSLQGLIWVIDPIDGTMNFIKQGDNFGIMISLFQDGVGLLGYLYDVMKNKMCFAVKDRGAYLDGVRLGRAEARGIGDSLLNIGDCVMRKEAAETKELLTKVLAFRSLGSAALAEISVFEGKACAYLNYRLQPWDISPALVIAKELGYVCQTIKGDEIDLLGETTCIIGTGRAVRQIQAIVGGLQPPY